MTLLDILIFAVNSVMPLIVLVALGYFLKEKGIFTKEFLKVGNKTVFRVLLPALLFTNIADMNDFSQLRWDAVLYVMIAIACLFTVGVLFTFTVAERKQKGVLLQCTFRSNFALIGVPLAQLMAGDEGVRAAALLSAFTIPTFNILAVMVLSYYAEDNSTGLSASQRIKKVFFDILKNPLILGVFFGIIVVLIKPFYYQLPVKFTGFVARLTFLQTALGYLAKASTPVALLVLGGQFELERIFGLKKQITIGVFARLLFAPLIGIGGAVLLQTTGTVHFDAAIYASLVALFGTPVAVASAIMAEEMNNDGQLAGQLVVWTTLFSAFSIFLIVAILRGLRLL